FVQFLQTVPAGDIKKEFLLPVFIDDLLKQGKVTVKMLESTDTWFGVTYAEDKDSVVQAFRNLTDAGLYPERF
ncbi:MAG: nucleotidyltransferase, partial [Clostridia bacterium]|nr:nucleotidyltransferase [Clostridia bacterium]